MIDIHHHLIHQMDDGAQTFEETKAMLCVAQAQGVSQIIATPHVVPGCKYFPIERFERHLRMAQTWCDENDISIQIYPGAEILYTEDTLRLLQEKKIPTLANSRYVLLEFSLDVTFERLCAAANRLGSAGYYCVFAHIERYRCLRKLKYIHFLKTNEQVLMQMNARTVLVQKGFLNKWWCWKVLEAGLIDIISSDAHSTESRRCRMDECFELICTRYGLDRAQQLFYNQAEAFLND